jgi:hypothetical protein
MRNGIPRIKKENKIKKEKEKENHQPTHYCCSLLMA